MGYDFLCVFIIKSIVVNKYNIKLFYFVNSSEKIWHLKNVEFEKNKIMESDIFQLNELKVEPNQ